MSANSGIETTWFLPLWRLLIFLKLSFWSAFWRNSQYCGKVIGDCKGKETKHGPSSFAVNASSPSFSPPPSALFSQRQSCYNLHWTLDFLRDGVEHRHAMLTDCFICYHWGENRTVLPEGNLMTSFPWIHICECLLNCSVVSISLQSHKLWPTRLLCLWNCPGKNTRADCHFLLQEILPTQRAYTWQCFHIFSF